MLQAEDINRLIGCREAYQMPDALMAIMMDAAKREALFESFLELKSDLSFDWFTDYFQTEHGDRDKLKQDYTPDCVTDIIAHMAGHADSYADLCAGCGGLTIKVWRDNPDALFVCEEISSRVLPVLLFNLAIRNMHAIVRHGDSLAQEWTAVYQLVPGDRFATIEKTEAVPVLVDRVISNPPYSLPWTPPKQDERFDAYGMAPKSKADYAFVLHGLSMLKPDGKACYILPHGVLFRGQAEGAIRKNLIEAGHLRSIISLPLNLFLYTKIPVCIMELTKSACFDDVLVVDASKDFDKVGKRYRMNTDHLIRLYDVMDNRRTVKKYASMFSLDYIAENDWNLNIPRYVDISEPEPVPELSECIDIFVRDIVETRQAQAELFDMIKILNGYTYEDLQALQRWERVLCGQSKRSSKKSQQSNTQKLEHGTQQALF